MTPGFAEVAPGVHVLRYPVLDVNATLVVGQAVALVVDTLATTAQGHELVTAVRAITDLPLVAVNTHGHFDHCFGNAALAQAEPGLSIWAHDTVLAALRDHAPRVRRAGFEEAQTVAPSIADEVAAVEIRAPDRGVWESSTLDLGGRSVGLHHFGRGHTEGDVVVSVPDAGVVVAGDLVEEGAPPSFDDAYPLDWPETLTALLALHPRLVVPGHGRVVDASFVHDQRAELSTLEWLIRDGHAARATPEEVAAQAPFGPEVAVIAARRGFADL
jgi:glyoxylase-like metal-dependent hydrolase (beta-lactamase superfamily II)